MTEIGARIGSFGWFLVCVIVTASAEGAMVKPPSPQTAPEVTYRWPVVAAPLLSTPPHIDGKVELREWYPAARIGPMVTLDRGLATQEETAFFIAYTPHALYGAFQFHRPRYALEPHASTEPMRVWRDDCLELFLRPVFGEKWEYSFVGNWRGVHEEGLRRSVTDKHWKAQWRFAARRTDWGWEGELAIPFESLKRPAPKPGEVWELAPVRNRKTPRQELACWSYLRTWTAKEDFGYLVFAGRAPAVRVLQAGDVSEDEVGCMIEIANFTARAVRVRVLCEVFRPRGEAKPYFELVDQIAAPLGPQAEAKQWVPASKVVPHMRGHYTVLSKLDRIVDVPAQQSRRVPFFVAASRGEYVLYYRVQLPDTGAVLGAGPLPFFKRAPMELSIVPYILASGLVEVTAEYRRLRNLAPADRVTIELRDARGNTSLWKNTSEVDLAAGRTVVEVPVSERAAGTYVIRCVLSGAGGEPKAETQVPFTLAERPAWWGNQYGIAERDDAVPEPWTPIERTPQGFRVWNRDVRLGRHLMPEQIRAGQTYMLARPATLAIELDRPIRWSAPQCVTERKTYVDYCQAFNGTDLAGELKLHCEFDGFMRYTLRIEARRRVELRSLVLEVPLRPALTTHYHHGALGTPPSYAQIKVRKGYGVLPADGLRLPFTDEIWLGNDEMGFEWVAESDQWWSPEKTKETVVVERTAAATVLRVNIVTKPRAIARRVKYEWALLPTPMKPMNREFLHDLFLAQSGFSMDETATRLSDMVPKYLDAMKEAGVNAFCQWAWRGERSVWNPDFGAPGYRPTPENRVRAKALKRAIGMAHARGIKRVIVYAIWSCFADWPDVGAFWREQARYPLVPSFKGYLYCPQQPFADWYVATLRRTIEEVGIDGVYLDSSPSPHLCANLHHGCGYVDEQGRLHGTYPVFATRELHKRIYYLFHGELKRGGLIYAHNSPFIFGVVESFVDVHHCGEGSSLRLQWLISKFYGYPFGLPVTFTRWNNPVYPETRMRSWRFVLQCDSTIKAHPAYVIKRFPGYRRPGREYFVRGYADKSIVVYKVWQAMKAFPWQGARWVPYWKAEPYARTGVDMVVPCLHVNPGKAALVVVSSFRDQPTTCTLWLNWRLLGFDPARVEVVDCITDESLLATRSGLRLEVLDNRWRMLSIRPQSAK